MSKNPLLLGWLMDTKDDCFPYYFSKLEFLQMYGKQCSNHAGTCKSAKTEQECNVKRVLKCSYTEGECVQVIDSICNYYDKEGNVKEEEWGEEQVAYINYLYKTAVNIKFGEFMLGKDYNKTVKTLAFQLISDKFNNIEYDNTLDKACSSSIKNILMKNSEVLNELFNLRSKAYNDMAKEHSQPFIFTPTIKNSELALYVFELLKIKKCGEYKTIFKHHKSDDNKIFEILTKKGVCFQEEHENDKTSSFFNLTNFDKEDFEYVDENKMEINKDLNLSTIFWKLSITIFNIAKKSVIGIGSILMVILTELKNIFFNKNMDIFLLKLVNVIIIILMVPLILTIYLNLNVLTLTMDDKRMFRELLNIISPLVCLLSTILTSAVVINFLKQIIIKNINTIVKEENNKSNENLKNNIISQKYKLYVFFFFLQNLTNGLTRQRYNIHMFDYNLNFVNKSINQVIALLLSPFKVILGKEHCGGVFNLIKGISFNAINIMDVNLTSQYLAPQYGDGINNIPSIDISKISEFGQITLNYIYTEYQSPEKYTYLKAFMEALTPSNIKESIITIMKESYTILLKNVSQTDNSKALTVVGYQHKSNFNIGIDIKELWNQFLSFDPLHKINAAFTNTNSSFIFISEINPNNTINILIKILIISAAVMTSKKAYDVYKNNKTNKVVKTIKSPSKSVKIPKSIKSIPSSPPKTIHQELEHPKNSIQSSHSERNKRYKRCPNGKHRNKSTKRCEPVEK